MKKMMILGGMIGFAIGVGFGLAHQAEWPSILWRASIATLVAGLLMRWWGRIWISSLRESITHDRGAGKPQTSGKS